MGLPEPHFTTFYPFRPGFFNFAGLLVSEPLIRPPGSKVQISIPTLLLTPGHDWTQFGVNNNNPSSIITPLSDL